MVIIYFTVLTQGLTVIIHITTLTQGLTVIIHITILTQGLMVIIYVTILTQGLMVIIYVTILTQGLTVTIHGLIVITHITPNTRSDGCYPCYTSWYKVWWLLPTLHFPIQGAMVVTTLHATDANHSLSSSVMSLPCYMLVMPTTLYLVLSCKLETPPNSPWSLTVQYLP